MLTYFLTGAAVGLSSTDVAERERIHLLLMGDARRGLADIEAGRTQEADAAIERLQGRRAGVAAKAPDKRG